MPGASLLSDCNRIPEKAEKQGLPQLFAAVFFCYFCARYMIVFVAKLLTKCQKRYIIVLWGTSQNNKFCEKVYVSA